MLGSLFCYELGVEAGIVAGIGIPVVAGGGGGGITVDTYTNIQVCFQLINILAETDCGANANDIR